MTREAWLTKSRAIDARADKLKRDMVARMRRVARAAGLDSTCPSLHAHNALIAFNQGQPWPEVDYALAREVLRIEGQTWEVGRLASSATNRLYHAFIASERAAERGAACLELS